LKLCYAEQADKRPADFASGRGSQAVLLLLERVNP
jgi:hypothetical protein